MSRKHKARRRRCPVCGVPLSQMVHAGITIDACIGCRGLWFDSEELERVLELPGPVFHSSRLRYTDSEPTSHRCPRGHGIMRAQVIQPDGFEYDRCPACGGLWLPLHRIHALLKELGATDADTTQEAEHLEAQVETAQEAVDAQKAARQASMDQAELDRAKREAMYEEIQGGPGQDWGPLWGSLGDRPLLVLVRLLASLGESSSKRDRHHRRCG